MVKGPLYLPDGQIDSDSGIKGWGPAVKAFATIRYTGANGNTTQAAIASNWAFDGQYNIAVGTTPLTINSPYAAFTVYFEEDLGTTNYEVLFTSANTDYTSTRRLNTTMVLAKSTNSFTFSTRNSNNTQIYPAEVVTGNFVFFTIIAK
jgi:hypothetical protein